TPHFGGVAGWRVGAPLDAPRGQRLWARMARPTAMVGSRRRTGRAEDAKGWNRAAPTWVLNRAAPSWGLNRAAPSWDLNRAAPSWDFMSKFPPMPLGLGNWTQRDPMGNDCYRSRVRGPMGSRAQLEKTACEKMACEKMVGPHRAFCPGRGAP